MRPLYSVQIPTDHGMKEISVYSCNILDFDEDIDILTTSAFVGSYRPTRGTMFEALNFAGISVMDLAAKPLIDLRSLCNVWLSDRVYYPASRIRRIGCIEISSHSYQPFQERERAIINSIKSYFCMLDIAADYDIKMDTLALPLIGSGRQRVSAELVIVPLLNECMSFLNRNPSVKRICFIEYSSSKAEMIADYLRRSYRIESARQTVPRASSPAPQNRPLASVFISYSSSDKNIADNLCSKLERRGIKVWYAPRDVIGPYASAIVNAIHNSTHFIVILSKNSMKSQHVLNEIDLAFQGLPKNIKFKPLRIDETMFTAEFEYYLSRQHWMDAIAPPLEARLSEFVDKFMLDV